MDDFNLDDFISPPGAFAPIYSWYWNAPADDAESERQIDEMLRLGMKAVYIIPEPKNFRPTTMPTELEPDYLTPEYFSRYAHAVRYAASRGMRVWLYDEGGWPSGGACGRVLKDHPELARSRLAGERFVLPENERYKRRRSDAVAAFCDGKMIAEGESFPADVTVTEYYSRRAVNGGADFPDLTDRRSADHFIAVTHEGYAKALGDMFGKTVTAVFTDEPKAPDFAPFRDELVRAYEERYGESVLPYLPVLAGEKEPDEKEIEVRRRWYDLCSRFFCENYLIPCREWSNRHDLSFTGHMDKDDEPDGCMSGCCYHLMRALRCLDIPGIDVIWRQIFPPREGEKDDPEQNRFYPRYASSAAAQTGSSYAMSESFGVYGSGLTYGQMRYVAAFQAVRGINLFNLMGISYARDGYHLAGEQPLFDERMTGLEYLPKFNRYLERLSYITSVGKRVCDTALYYPVSDYWGGVKRQEMAERFDRLGYELEAAHVDFDIIDDDIIAASSPENGVIVCGIAAYRRVLIPEGAYLPDATKQALARFVEGGGYVGYSADGVTAAAELTGDSKDIRVMRRITENGGQDIICLFNQDGGRRSFAVKTGDKNAAILSPEDGSMTPAVTRGGYAGITLESGGLAALIISSDIPEAEEKAEYDKSAVIGGMTIRRVRGMEFTGDTIEIREYDDPPRPAVAGDWRDAVGDDFSGSCEYVCKVTLAGDAEKGGYADLGDVCYIAEAYFDGHPLGEALMPPYRFDIPAELLCAGSHELRIVITNTPANRYLGTDFFERYEQWQLSPYFPKEMTYMPDTAVSGLIGPIKVMYR